MIIAFYLIKVKGNKVISASDLQHVETLVTQPKKSAQRLGGHFSRGIRVFMPCVKIFARASREQACRSSGGECEPNSASLRSQSELRSDECRSQRKRAHRLVSPFSLAAALGFEPR